MFKPVKLTDKKSVFPLRKVVCTILYATGNQLRINSDNNKPSQTHLHSYSIFKMLNPLSEVLPPCHSFGRWLDSFLSAGKMNEEHISG